MSVQCKSCSDFDKIAALTADDLPMACHITSLVSASHSLCYLSIFSFLFFVFSTRLIFLFSSSPALDLKSELFTLFIPSPRPIVVVYLTKNFQFNILRQCSGA